MSEMTLIVDFSEYYRNNFFTNIFFSKKLTELCLRNDKGLSQWDLVPLRLTI